MHSLPASAAPAAEQPDGLSDGACIGAMVPKRWARRAVTRNLIKRQIYSLAASHAPEFAQTPHVAHVVRLSAAFDTAHFKSASSDGLRRAVRAEIEQLFQRALGTPQPTVSA